MRHIYLTFFLLCAGFVAQAQGSWVFTYDGNGNRIKREYVVSNGRMAAQPLQEEATAEEETLAEVSISPNPTPGEVTVAIPAELLPTATVRVFTTSGALVYVTERPTALTRLNLTGRPRGLYLVQVHTPSAVTTRKVLLE